MGVKIIEIEPKYRKENGMFVVDIDKLKIPFEIKERNLVYIPPREKGGNHKHPRMEAFVGMGNGLKLIWEDENGQRVEKYMNDSEKLFLFVIPTEIPHVVVNESNDQIGVLMEFADDIQHDVKKVEIL